MLRKKGEGDPENHIDTCQCLPNKPDVAMQYEGEEERARRELVERNYKTCWGGKAEIGEVSG